MAANVETMMYVREKPWHGLGTMVAEAPTSAKALELAGLDWEVESNPIYDQYGNEISGYKANTRSSDNSVLGIVSGKYNICQNREAFDFTDALIGEGITYETAGSLRNGKQIWLLGKMPERFVAGDKVEPYICFTNTHDGTGAVRVCMTPIRVVCNNTLNLALSEATRNWSAIHRGDIKGKLEEARHTLQLAEDYMNTLEEKADQLANETMTVVDVHAVLEQLFKMDKDMSDRRKNRVKEQREEVMAYMIRPDLAQFIGTKWGFINGVADYVGHAEPARKAQNWEENRWGYMIGGSWLLDRACELVGAK